MNTRVKKILGLALAFNIFSSVVPTTLSIGTQEAYAASNGGYLTGIKVETNKDKSVTLYTKSSCKSSYKLSKADEIPTSIYGEVSDNIKKIKITEIDLSDSKYTYKIYKGSTEVDLDEEVKTSSSTTLKVEIYEGSNKVQTYSIKITKDDDDDDDDDDDMDDDIYLDDITLSYNYDNVKLGFKQKTTEYNIEVENKVNFLRVAAEPEDDDDRVKVNGTRVKEEDDWETKVSLVEGKNKIEVEVRDEDQENERIYTINVTRLSSNGTTSNNNSTSTGTSNVNKTENEINKYGWKYINGNWQYYDANGNLYKNSWYTDASGKSYYLGTDGNMVTGWANVGGNQYYFDLASGERKTGWICLGKEWYQFDSRGVLVK